MIIESEKKCFKKCQKQTRAINTDCSRKCEPAVRRADFCLGEASYCRLFVHLPASLTIVFHTRTRAPEISETQQGRFAVRTDRQEFYLLICVTWRSTGEVVRELSEMAVRIRDVTTDTGLCETFVSEEPINKFTLCFNVTHWLCDCRNLQSAEISKHISRWDSVLNFFWLNIGIFCFVFVVVVVVVFQKVTVWDIVIIIQKETLDVLHMHAETFFFVLWLGRISLNHTWRCVEKKAKVHGPKHLCFSYSLSLCQ